MFVEKPDAHSGLLTLVRSVGLGGDNGVDESSYRRVRIIG